MQIDVRVLNANPEKDVREALLCTIGKKYTRKLSGGNEELYEFWKDLFIQKHSIIRSIHIRVSIPECRADVCRQLLRATKGHPQPYVQSSRPDWTGKPRSSDPGAPTMFIHDFTPESLMFLAQQRLCFRAMKETRETVQKICRILYNNEDPLLAALGVCMVPNCVFQGGCPEGKFNCGWYENTFDKVPRKGYPIRNRYADYVVGTLLVGGNENSP